MLVIESSRAKEEEGLDEVPWGGMSSNETEHNLNSRWKRWKREENWKNWKTIDSFES